MSLKTPLTVEMAALGDTAKTASPAAAPAVDPWGSRAVDPSTSTAADDGTTSIVWILLKVSGGVGIVVVVVWLIMSLMSNKGDQTQASNSGQGNLRISNAKASTIEEVAEPLNFFLWNPHWECFVWNQKGCAGHVLAQMRDTLKDKRVDFAAGIMLATDDLGLPEGYSHTRHYCRKDVGGRTDVVDLIYDSRRWKAIDETKKVGCMDMESNDRPFVVQEFEPVVSNADSEPLAIIAAHFPHTYVGQSGFAENIAATVGKALKEVRDASSKLQRVALIADTNAESDYPSSKIAEWLGMPGGLVMPSELKFTCCADSNFDQSMTYDRVIANFGTKIETQVWFDDGKDLPSWTCQEKTPGLNNCAAFHKPVLATVYPPALSPIEARPRP